MSGNMMIQAYMIRIEQQEDRIEELEAALYRIKQWADAYPLEVFPEMDDDYMRRANELLQRAGMHIDRIAADAMRHVVQGVGNIAREALKGSEGNE
jgi:hypothetical protein